MKKKFEKAVQFLLPILALITLTIFLFPLVKSGIPETHDGESHVARAANFAAALRQGQFPPRWAGSFWNGFGYPVFNFHYPLLSYLTSPLLLVGLHPEVAVKVILILTVLSLGIALVLLGNRLGKTQGGWFALLVMLLSPYFFNLLYVRGSYGELLGYTSALWVLVASISLLKKPTPKWVIIMGSATLSLCLAHNITTMLLWPLLALTLLFLSTLKRQITPLIHFTLGTLASTFFWLPALFEKHFTRLDEVISTKFTDHFTSVSQLLFDPVGQGISVAGVNDGLSLAVGSLSLFALVLSLIPLPSKPTRPLERPLGIGLVVGGILVLFLSTTHASFLWFEGSLITYLQFPWRLVGLAVLLAAMSGLLHWSSLPPLGKISGVLLIFFLIPNRLLWPIRPSIHFSKDYYFAHPLTSTVWDELRAKTFTVPEGTTSVNHPLLPDHQYTIAKWRGTYRRYSVNLPESTYVIEPTMFFPGWETRVNGTKISYDLSQSQGQLAFHLPPGTHAVSTRFTQNTPTRLAGNLLSLLAIVSILVAASPRGIKSIGKLNQLLPKTR